MATVIKPQLTQADKALIFDRMIEAYNLYKDHRSMTVVINLMNEHVRLITQHEPSGFRTGRMIPFEEIAMHYANPITAYIGKAVTESEDAYEAQLRDFEREAVAS